MVRLFYTHPTPVHDNNNNVYDHTMFIATVYSGCPPRPSLDYTTDSKITYKISNIAHSYIDSSHCRSVLDKNSPFIDISYVHAWWETVV